ncbi:[NiFe]-hydrogenase assembly chaperone HybE [Bradyrhizobium sp. 38]|uniref:[NiFe]-hydrogenase assembly chaperone HybE n=1 Tax=unclassified Bradyrhizobium TaxID=2631580 RepID=UPI001FF88185|nr:MULTISPECIES: [NiFe]-hydrogenase assembly chaperone HybE [unclassified Bradyrhizobium]MCK1341390.1 [NiFe]-hydrogenase assembly chaperone HybE [Bradyrhizobium sp. 38]MCK1409970.1 [NiFe]-hydrogenase assembly chaperone HybE [Bradyrhizobium sp. 76]MCK1780899.1 [NiFe]-hydrogenase assembly chaperone HybE [Bradyrhizobium sp. 132]
MTADAQIRARDANAEAWGELLAGSYREIGERAVRDLPIYNNALGVEAVGFRWFNGTTIGVMVTPWFMNVVIPASAIARDTSGPSLRMRFPAGDLEFTVSEVGQMGRIASCSLFSPMFQFADIVAARATAKATFAELMLPANSEEAVRCREPATSPIDRRNFLRGVLTERCG